MIALLVNPISGNGKAIKAGNWLSRELSSRNISFTLFDINWPVSFTGFKEIWLVGGDGTINYFLNHYQIFTIPLVFFKGGTGNDFAWKLYGDITLAEQLHIALHAAPKYVDAGTCNGRLFVNSSGIGFDGEVLKSIGTIRWLGGHLGYLAIVIKKIFSFREFTFNIQTPDMKFSGKYLLVIINNSSRTGGGFMVTPKASVNDGKLDLLLCAPLSIFKRLKYLPVIEKGKHLALSFITYLQSEQVLITSEIEMYAQLDGELIKSKTFDLQVLPNKLLVKY